MTTTWRLRLIAAGLLVVILGVTAIPVTQNVLDQTEPSPLTYNTYTIPLTPLLPNGVRRGDEVKFTATRCVSGKKPVAFTSSTILLRSDGRTWGFPSSARTVDPGCVTTTGSFFIPDDPMFGPGLWHLDVTLVVQGERLKHIVHWVTDSFEVKVP